MKNIFAQALAPKEGEKLEKLLSCKNVKIERIVSSDIIPDKIYKQEQDEWVLVLKGRAKLDLDGKIIELEKGDTCFIPSGKPHKVLEVRKDTLWLAIHIY